VKVSRIIYVFAVLLFAHDSQGQNTVVAERTLNLGLQARARTVGFDGKYAIQKSEDVYSIFDFDLVTIKHPKEQKVTNPLFPDPSPFVFGKLNTLYNFRLGYGKKKTLGKRVSRNTINISVLGVAGLNIGILKPIYLDIYHNDAKGEYFAQERYDPAIHNESNIIGSSGFGYGFGELKMKPGIYLKSGIEFGWGNYQTNYKAIEVGAIVDAFFSEIPLMYLTDNKQFYSGFYISFAFAKIY
jgi:hypothetical protein